MKYFNLALKVVLFCSGLFIVFTGLNIGLGGMETLGWQNQNSFFEVTNQYAFSVQDSHIRFVGGVWLGIGLLFLISITNLSKYKNLLSFSFLLIFFGGLIRLLSMDFNVIFGQDILGSLLAEILGMPLLYFWLDRATAPIEE